MQDFKKADGLVWSLKDSRQELRRETLDPCAPLHLLLERVALSFVVQLQPSALD